MIHFIYLLCIFFQACPVLGPTAVDALVQPLVGVIVDGPLGDVGATVATASAAVATASAIFVCLLVQKMLLRTLVQFISSKSVY
jgi:orotidine-5'-phosphate decarboxylase